MKLARKKEPKSARIEFTPIGDKALIPSAAPNCSGDTKAITPMANENSPARTTQIRAIQIMISLPQF